MAQEENNKAMNLIEEPYLHELLPVHFKISYIVGDEPDGSVKSIHS